MQILNTYRVAVRRRFYEFVERQAQSPQGLRVPANPKDALELGIRLGRKEGYGTGLVDGTTLGLDVGLETMDAIHSQPVIIGHSDPV